MQPSAPPPLARWSTRVGAALLDALVVFTIVLIAGFVMAMFRIFLGLESMTFTLWLLITAPLPRPK